MNPTAPQLDPKLKETYDRVMGAQFTPQPIQPPNPAMPSASAVPSPAKAEPQPASPVTSPQVFVASPATPTGKTTVVKNPSGKKISPVVFIVIGLAFFVAYTVVWLKVFSII